MIINISNIIGDTSSNDGGARLFSFLDNAKLKDENITIEIDPEVSISSSFLNSSIGHFLDLYGKEVFFNTVRFKGSKTQFERMKSYINKYINTYNIN